MKKFFYLCILSLMTLSCCLMTSCNKDEDSKNEKEKGEELVTEGFADLGLPSGTKWKATNEGDGYYTYDEAAKKFGKKVPTKAQFEELVNECKWTWVDKKGFKITGKNKKAIMLPAGGSRGQDGTIYSVGAEGFYWTSTPFGPDRGYRLGFNKEKPNINYMARWGGGTIRLIE